MTKFHGPDCTHPDCVTHRAAVTAQAYFSPPAPRTAVSPLASAVDARGEAAEIARLRDQNADLERDNADLRQRLDALTREALGRAAGKKGGAGQ